MILDDSRKLKLGSLIFENSFNGLNACVYVITTVQVGECGAHKDTGILSVLEGLSRGMFDIAIVCEGLVFKGIKLR